MTLDDVTLVAIGCLAIGLSGLFLLLAWAQMRRETALLWWAAAHVVYAAGTFLILAYRASGQDAGPLAGLLISSVAPVLFLAGASSFARGRASGGHALAGAVLIVLTVAATYAGLGITAATVASFGGWIGLLAAAAAALLGGWREALPARWGLMALLAVHALVYAGGIHDLLAGDLPLGAMPRFGTWFSIVYFEGLAYAMGTAIFMVLLCNEREQARYKRAAQVDTLTGAASRSALFERGQRLLLRSRDNGTPLSLIVFDLDHFKAINDSFGHHAGDRVLAAFADSVRSVLRPNDLFGRHGGEEFAVVLPGAGLDAAYVIAERIRVAFASAAPDPGGKPLNATVSAGVAPAGVETTFQALVDAADEAMYRAKSLGRNRVERTHGVSDVVTHIDRVA
jgi:diguanylate cyclase (GGDEF)-like protein